MKELCYNNPAEMKEMKKYIRKADIILFIVLVAAGLASSAALALRGNTAGDRVIIESGGDLYATYALAEDRIIIVPSPKQIRTDAPDGSVGGSADGSEESTEGSSASSAKYDYYNTVEIKDGKVSVSEASCKNQICVKHSSISHSGESIVCLPNRLVVRIDSRDGDSEKDGEGDGYDTVTS